MPSARTEKPALPSGRKRRPGGGRPRNPDIDVKILSAARSVYASAGWGGFTFDAVAQQATVSRDAIYRRYADRQQLLLAAVVVESLPIIDSSAGGDFRQVITESWCAMFDYFTIGAGPLLFRIHLEARRFPEVYQAYRDNVVEPNLRATEAAVGRLLSDAGLNIETVDVPAFVEMLSGSVLMHALLNQEAVLDVEQTQTARAAVVRQVNVAFTAIGVSPA